MIMGLANALVQLQARYHHCGEAASEKCLSAATFVRRRAHRTVSRQRLKRQLATASTHPYRVCTCHMCSSGSLLPELLGKPDENSFGAPDVAEAIRVFVLDHFADELRAAFAEPGERIVDVLHGEHDA